MELVALLALATTMGIWALPWALHRGVDPFPWRASLRGQATSVWWGLVSIMSVAGVMMAGRAFGLAGAVASGLALESAFAWTFHRRYSTARRLQTLCAAVATGPAEKTLPALEAALARFRETSELRTNGYEAWAQWTLHAAIRASLAGNPAEALRWAEGIDPKRLSPKARWGHAQNVAALRVSVGDRPGARALLASARRPAEPAPIELGIQAIEGLLEALEGDPLAALARADAALASLREPALKMTWLAARAHALAGSNAHVEARALLHAIRAEHGDLPLRRIANHRGPASAAAEALLATHEAYR